MRKILTSLLFATLTLIILQSCSTPDPNLDGKGHDKLSSREAPTVIS